HADPFQPDGRLRAAVRALQRIDFQTGRLLRLVADLRLPRAWGFRSLPDYVRERLAFSSRKARMLLALVRGRGARQSAAATSGRRDARPAPARTGADVCARLRRERALPRTRLRRGAPLDRDPRVHSAKRATVGGPRAASAPRDGRVGATAPASRPDLRARRLAMRRARVH